MRKVWLAISMLVCAVGAAWVLAAAIVGFVLIAARIS